jgi:hypothetical protein
MTQGRCLEAVFISTAPHVFDPTVASRGCKQQQQQSDLRDDVGSDNDSACSDITTLSASSATWSLSASSSATDDSLLEASLDACSAIIWASFHDCLTRPSSPGLGWSPSASLFELDPLPELAANDEALDLNTFQRLALAVDFLTAEEEEEAAESEAAAEEDEAKGPAKAERKATRRRVKLAEAEAKASEDKAARRTLHENRERRNVGKAARRLRVAAVSDAAAGDVEAALRELGLVSTA